MREVGVFPWVLVALLVTLWLRRPAARRELALRCATYSLGVVALLYAGASMLGVSPPAGRLLTVAALQLSVVLPIIFAALGLTAWLERRLQKLGPRSGRVLAAVTAQGFVFVIGLPLLVLSLGVRRANGGSSTPAKLLGRPASAVSFVGHDGTPLRGVWVASDERRGAVLLVHGLAAEKLGFLEAVRSLSLRGYDVLSFDLRGHGESGGHTTTLGAVEQHDVRAAWKVLLEKTSGRDIPRLVVGISLGGAAAQLAAPDLASLDGVLLDSTFARAEAPASRFLRLPAPVVGVMLGMARALAVPLTGHAVLDVAPVAAAARGGTYAVTLVHATGDPLIPYDEARTLLSAYGARATLVTIDASVHPATFAAPERYDDALLALARDAEARHAPP